MDKPPRKPAAASIPATSACAGTAPGGRRAVPHAAGEVLEAPAPASGYAQTTRAAGGPAVAVPAIAQRAAQDPHSAAAAARSKPRPPVSRCWN